MESAQYKAWQFLRKHGKATSLAIESDPNIDLGKKAAYKALRHLERKGAAKAVGFRKIKHGYSKVFGVADEDMAPSKPKTLEV